MNIFLVALRIFLAASLGAIIGIEREMKHRAAGFRTHIIVSVGACLIMLIGVDAIGEISSDKARDVARIAGQVVSGIGFLGAGTILQKKGWRFRSYYSCNFMAICSNRSCRRNRLLCGSNICNYHLSNNFGSLEGIQRFY